MKQPVEIFDNAADFLRAQKGTSRRQSSGDARKGTKRDHSTTTTAATFSGAHSEPGRGDMQAALGRIAVYRFSVQFQPSRGFYFWHVDGRSTTARATYHAAIAAAEQELSK